MPHPPPSKAIRDEGFFAFKKKAGPGLCWVKGCIRQSRADRCLCHKHEMQRWRSKKKCPSAYHALKHHAKARGVLFTITPEYFRGLVDAYGFFDEDVNRHSILTIDRVDGSRGYEPGNLRVISISANVAKGNRERHLPEHVRSMLERERRKVRSENAAHLEEEDPF